MVQIRSATMIGGPLPGVRPQQAQPGGRLGGLHRDDARLEAGQVDGHARHGDAAVDVPIARRAKRARRQAARCPPIPPRCEAFSR